LKIMFLSSGGRRKSGEEVAFAMVLKQRLMPAATLTSLGILTWHLAPLKASSLRGPWS
jgi:hypothetical protein